MRAAVAGVCGLLSPFLLAVTLQAQEPEIVVRELHFVGNKSIPDEVLRAGIVTTTSSWFASFALVRWIGLGEKRYFDEEEFRRDVIRLHVLYRRSGFPNAVVDTAVRREPGNIFIKFLITEGAPMVTTQVRVTGIDSLPAWLRNIATLDLPLQVGDPFNRYLMQQSADSIERRLRDRGYPSASVFTGFEANRERLAARVNLEVDPSTRAVIGDVDVVGVRRIDTTVVRDLLVSRPGRRYSQDELLVSQQNLYQSDLFRYATVNIDSAGFQPGGATVPLLVQVNESRRRRIRGSLGYATEDCFRGGLGWTFAQLSRGRRPSPRLERPGLQGRCRGPNRLGPRRRDLQLLGQRLDRLFAAELSPRGDHPPAGVPQRHHQPRGLGVHRAALGIPGVPAARDRHQPSRCGGSSCAAGFRSRSPTT